MRLALMARVLALNLRNRVVEAVSAGLPCWSVAARVSVCVSHAISWVARVREDGNYTPKNGGGNHRPHHVDAHHALIQELVEAEPDPTLAELSARLAYAFGNQPPLSVVHRIFP